MIPAPPTACPPTKGRDPEVPTLAFGLKKCTLRCTFVGLPTLSERFLEHVIAVDDCCRRGSRPACIALLASEALVAHARAAVQMIVELVLPLDSIGFASTRAICSTCADLAAAWVALVANRADVAAVARKTFFALTHTSSSRV